MLDLRRQTSDKILAAGHVGGVASLPKKSTENEEFVVFYIHLSFRGEREWRWGWGASEERERERERHTHTHTHTHKKKKNTKKQRLTQQLVCRFMV